MLFIFDMDNVLYDYDWRVRMAGLTALTGHDLAELRRRWWHDEGEWAAEAGRFDDAESYFEAFTSAIGSSMSEAEWLANRKAAMSPWADSLEAVTAAAELGQVTLLTNNNPMAAKYLAELAPELVPLFGEHRFTSSQYGARKPDPTVFRRVLERYGVPAEQAFFADDMAANVDGARSIGITGYHFGDAAGMLAAVREFGER